MKKLFLLVVLMGCFCLTGCGNENISGSLEDIMASVYDGISDEEKPMMLINKEVNEKNIEGFLGTDDIDFKEALASESGVGSIPHSVVLLRVEDMDEVEEIKREIKDNINPRRWICVEASNVYIESKGDLIIVIMSNDIADNIKDNFLNLK